MTEITTVGQAKVHLRAERGTIAISPSFAAADAAKAVAAVEKVIAEFAARADVWRASNAATWHRIGPVTTWTRVVGQDDDRVEHVARATVDVKFADLALIGPLVSELASRGISVHPTWALTEATRTQRERDMRIAAVHDARRLADDYAAALGTTVTTVLAVEGHRSGMALPSARASADGAAQLTIPEITVEASVTLRVRAD